MARKKLRHELKYYIHQLEMDGLRPRLKTWLTFDRNSVSPEGYHIRSLYFDNVYESALNDKTSGIYQRKKYRVRIYNKSDHVIKLERKSKFNQFVMKESAPISKDDFYALLQGDALVLRGRDDPLLIHFYHDMVNDQLKPSVVVDYVREAYIHPIYDVRVTFDKCLSTSIQSFDIFDQHLATQQVIEDPQVILEVKYHRFFPQVLFDLLQIPTHNRSAISKYVLCKERRKTYSY